jgi:2-polyprenyl-6-methoxyphenol hydroxylase-like FAD-dependent oxidoreductase
VGDAAHCASPVSGMSTSLALTGAYVLAGELAAATTATGIDHRRAFARYESVMRPYVDRAQRLPPGAPRIAHPRTAAGARLVRAMLRFARSRVARRLGGLADRLFTPPADALALPTYPDRAAASARP